MKIPLRKHTLNLYDGDWDSLARLYPGQDTSSVVREILHNFIEKKMAGVKPAALLKGIEIDV